MHISFQPLQYDASWFMNLKLKCVTNYLLQQIYKYDISFSIHAFSYVFNCSYDAYEVYLESNFLIIYVSMIFGILRTLSSKDLSLFFYKEILVKAFGNKIHIYYPILLILMEPKMWILCAKVFTYKKQTLAKDFPNIHGQINL